MVPPAEARIYKLEFSVTFFLHRHQSPSNQKQLETLDLLHHIDLCISLFSRKRSSQPETRGNITSAIFNNGPLAEGLPRIVFTTSWMSIASIVNAKTVSMDTEKSATEFEHSEAGVENGESIATKIVMSRAIRTNLRTCNGNNQKRTNERDSGWKGKRWTEKCDRLWTENAMITAD